MSFGCRRVAGPATLGYACGGGDDQELDADVR